MKKLYLLLVLVILATLPIFEAQAKVVPSTNAPSSNNKEVTLTVVGSGNTKEEATRNGLRSALEQTYGAFVSSNTTIINDELVQDAVSTITNNCVKSYKELSTESLPNGSWFVTLQVTVSVSGLVSYAQSKGSSVEFAGNTFGMNMKIRELNKQNELKAVYNLLIQLISLGNLFDYELTIGEPQESSNSDDQSYYICHATVSLHFNDNTRAFNELAYQVLSNLSLTKAEINEFEQTNTPYYFVELPGTEFNPNWKFNCKFAMRNNYTDVLGDFLIDIIKTPLEYQEDFNFKSILYGYNKTHEEFHYTLASRNPNDFVIWCILTYLMDRSALCFKISDNLSDPSNLKINSYSWMDHDKCKSPWIYWLSQHISDTGRELSLPKVMKENRKNGDIVGFNRYNIYIPKADISKYSNFEVKPVTDKNLHDFINNKLNIGR